ncbi:MAG: hypothetical protein HUU15_02135 [Candidatus Brocadiae bacterium]|nr:hypothetical protein [Candidatus Brocadiia bacterium]
MNIRNWVLAAVAGIVAAGCSEPVSHHTVRAEVFNVDAAVDATTTVFNRHFNGKIEEKAKRGDTWVVRSGYIDELDMNERRRVYAKATITPLSDEEVDIDVVAFQQKDESDTGYGERSPSSPKWGVETHDQEMERRLLEDIRYELEKAQEYRR